MEVGVAVCRGMNRAGDDKFKCIEEGVKGKERLGDREYKVLSKLVFHIISCLCGEPLQSHCSICDYQVFKP